MWAFFLDKLVMLHTKEKQKIILHLWYIIAEAVCFLFVLGFFWDASATGLSLAMLWWFCLRIHTIFFMLIMRYMKPHIVLLQSLSNLHLSSFSKTLNITLPLSKSISAFQKFFQSYFVSFCCTAVTYFLICFFPLIRPKQQFKYRSLL